MTPAAIRKIAQSLGLSDDSRDDWLGFSADGKGVAWTFMGRDAPKAKRRPVIAILAIRCPLERKEHLLAAAPDVYLDDPHYKGYPAILVRIAAIKPKELTALLTDARNAAPPKRAKRKEA